MSGQEALRRLAAQLQAGAARSRVGTGGNGQGFPGGGKGLFAGSGLVLALLAGGIGLNAALFNGTVEPSWDKFV